MFKLEQRAIASLDDDGGEWQLGQSLRLKGERAVRECRGEVVEALPLDRGEERSVWCVDGVVAGADGRSHGFRALPGEPVGVALAGVDADRDRAGEGAPARDPRARVRGTDGLLGLPEDRLAVASVEVV